MSSLPENTQSVTGSQPGAGTSAGTPTAQQLWETAVCLAATRARAALPHSNGRIDKAQQLVLDGSVELLDDHSARVKSQKDGETQYYVVNGSCTCPDFERAPANQCKHRIARGIAVRAVQIARELGDTAALQAVSPQPGIPGEFIVQIQGKPFITFQGLLYLAHQQGLLSLSEEVTHVTETYVIAAARAEFHDGRVFRGAGDSSPDNVGKQVKAHWRRLAGTRAMARALRIGLGVNLVAVEELD